LTLAPNQTNKRTNKQTNKQTNWLHVYTVYTGYTGYTETNRNETYYRRDMQW
jgi:hypothetical protein